LINEFKLAAQKVNLYQKLGHKFEKLAFYDYIGNNPAKVVYSELVLWIVEMVLR
jgi:hypothetical protein